MPTYSYRCTYCGEDLERNVKIAERDNQSCEKTGALLTRKIDKPGAVWSPTRNGGISL